MPQGSELQFRLRKGTKFARKPTLLVNLPEPHSAGGAPRYTAAEPFNLDGSKPEQGSGWDLRTDFYARFSPKEKKQEALVTFLTFEVVFEYPGSFFVQIEYEGEDGARLCSVPSYINVEPVLKAGGEAMRCKELSIMTVISRCLGKVDNWKKVLAPLSSQNYNAVHLAPI